MSIEEIKNFIRTNIFRVVLGRIDGNVIKIAEKYGNPKLQGNIIFIENFNGDIPGLSSDLLNYNIIEMAKVEGNLEEVFFKLIGEQK